MKNYKIVIAMILVTIIAGKVFAQENRGVKKDFAPVDFGSILGGASMSVPASSLSFNLDLLAEGGAKKPFGGSPFLAGLLNMPFGIWSWINKDWLGGSITAGLAIGGIAMMFVAPDLILVGLGMYVASPIYGYIRGSSQYKKMTSGIASTNPINHITVLPVPTGSKGDVGVALAYSMNF